MNLYKNTMKNQYKTILLIIITSFIISYLDVLFARFIIYIIDGAVMNKIEIPRILTMYFYGVRVFDKILVLSFFMLFLAILISVFIYIRGRYNIKFKLKMNDNIKKLILEHTTYLDYMEYVAYDKSQILQRVTTDANDYVNYISEKTNLVLMSLFYTLISLKVIIELSFPVVFILGGIILFIILISIWYCYKTKEIVNKKVSLSEKIIRKTINGITNPKIIKMNNNQEKEIAEFSTISSEYLDYDIKEIDYLIYYELIVSGIRLLGNPLIYLVCGIMIIKGKMNIGSLMAIIIYSTNILNYLRNLIFAIEDINIFLVPARRIAEFLKLDQEDKNIEVSNDFLFKSIQFKDVSIKFDNNYLLNNLNFKINQGDDIYIVGSNGSGKSVIAKTLLGFINYEGKILIDEMDMKKINKKNLRNNIGLCFQEPYIFSDTIKNNIDCFNKVSLQNVEIVSKVCKLDEEIGKFNKNYDSFLNEGGTNLSGGQKQRINIARLLIQNKKFLIFDDVLSKIDGNTKKEIINNLKNNYPNNINIFITHDLLQIPENAKVLFIENNTIVNSTNKKLTETNENYRKLLEICSNVVGD